MKHTMQYSVGDEVAHVPSNEADEFNAVAKEQNVTPEPIFTYRVSNKQGDVQQLDVPKAEYEEFAKTAGDNGYKIEPLRMMTMDDGTERYFSARELRAFMRSPEYLNSTDGAEAKARDEAVRQRIAEEEANAPGFWSELGRRMFTVGGARDNAEDSDWAKPYAYANDLCNALVGGLLKGSAKIEQAFGHLVGSDAIVRDAQAGQAAVDEYLPTDALDTKKPGAANKVLDVGKNVASVTGEFAPSLIPGVGQAYAASLVGGGATIRYMQVYDDAIAHGVDPDKAVGLASLGATVDAGQNMLLMGKFKGVWKGEQANLAQAAKEGLVRRLTKDTLKTGAIMSGGGMAGDVIDQAAEDKYWLDVERTAKVGFDQFIEGGLFHLVNTGVHNATRIKWGDDAKGIPAGAARDMMEAPEGRALIFSNSPDAARAIFKARRNGENVSRKMIEDLGLSGDVARTAADRNALGDRLMADYDAFKERVRTKMDDVQAAALTDEIASRSEEGVNNPAFEKVWFKAVEQIKDATELDDPARRKEIVDEAVKTTETPEERRQREQAVEDAIKARQAEDAAAQKAAEEGKTTVLPPETAPKATVEAPKTSDEAKSVEIQATTKPEEAGTTKETSGAPSAPTPVPERPAEARGTEEVKTTAESPKAEVKPPARDVTFEPFDYKMNNLPTGTVVEDVDGKRYTHDVHGGWVDESGKTHLSDVAFKDGYAVVNKGGDVPKTDVGVPKTATDVPKAKKTVPNTTTTEAGTKPKHLTFAVTADGETPTPVTEAASAVRNAQSMLYRVRFSPAGKKRVEDATNKFNSTVEAFKKTISDPSVSLEELKAEADRFDEQEQKYMPKDISYSQHHNWAIGNAIRAEIARREGTEAPPERDAFHPQGVKPEDPWMESVRKDEDALAMRKRYKEAKTDDERKAIKAEFDKLVEKHKAEWEGQNGKIEEPTAKDVAEKPTLVAEKPVEKPSATEDVQKTGTSSRTLSDVARELEASKGLANPEERDKKVAKLQDEIDAMRTPGKDFEPFAGKPNAAKAAKCVADFLYKQTEKEKKDPKRSGDKLAKVFHDKESGVAVATDGRVMIATKHGFDPNGEADPTYPNWRIVVPKEENTPLSTKVNPTALAKTCKEVLRLARATGLKTDSEYSVPKIALKFGDFVNHFSAEYMLKVAKAMEANGITEIRTADKPGHPGVAKNGDTTIVFMPYRGANGDNTRTGRGDGGFVVNGYNGRIIAAPERTDNNLKTSPERLKYERGQFDEYVKDHIERGRKSGLYKAVAKARKSGETDVEKVYEAARGDGAKWSELKPELRDEFTKWMKAETDDQTAEMIGEYLMSRDVSAYNKKSRQREIEKIEKRIAAEDEIEGLIMRGQEARDFLGIKPEKAKPAEKVSDYDVEQEVKRVVGLIGKAENATQLKEYADSFKFKDLDMVDGIKIDHDRISEALNKRSEELFGKSEAEASAADNIASEIGGLIGNHLKAQTTAKNNSAGRKFKAEAKDALAKRLSELSDDEYASVKKNLKAIMGENGLDPAKAGYVQAIFNAETAKRNAAKTATVEKTVRTTEVDTKPGSIEDTIRRVSKIIDDKTIDVRMKDGERERLVEDIRTFHDKYRDTKIPLSTGANLVFKPSSKTVERYGDYEDAWAEYAIHAVTNDNVGKDGKHYRVYNGTKARDVMSIIPEIVAEDKTKVDAKTKSVTFYHKFPDGKHMARVIADFENGDYRADLVEVTSVYQKGSKIPADVMPLDRAVAELIRKEGATISEPKKEMRPVITRHNSGRSTESPSTGESVPQANGGVKAAPGKFTDSVYEAYSSAETYRVGAKAFAEDTLEAVRDRIELEIRKAENAREDARGENGTYKNEEMFDENASRVEVLNGQLKELESIADRIKYGFEDDGETKSEIHEGLRDILSEMNAISPIEGFEDIGRFKPRRGAERTGVKEIDDFNDKWDDEGVSKTKPSDLTFGAVGEAETEIEQKVQEYFGQEIAFDKKVYDQLSDGDKRYFGKLMKELDDAKDDVCYKDAKMSDAVRYVEAHEAVEQFGESARKMSELMRDNEGRPVLYTEKSNATEMAADGVRRAVKAFASRDPAEATAATEMINLAIENGGKFPTKKQVAEMAKDMPEEMRETFTRNADALRKYADGLKDKPSIADEATKLAEDVDAAIDAEEKGGGERPDAAPRGRGTGAISQDEPKPQGTTTTGRTSGIVTPQSFLKEARKLFPDVAMRGKGTARMAKWAAGHFEATTRTIRSRDMSAIRTITHELGHDLEYLTRYDLPRNPAAKRDLSDLGHALYPSGPGMPKPNSYIGEGFAEYVRGYICNAPDLAQVAPDMDAWFRGDFKAKHPEIVRKIDRLRDMVQTMKEQSAADTVRGFRHPATTVVERAWKKVTDFGASENWNDAASTILKGMKKSGIDKLYHWQDEFKELEAAVKAGDTVRAQQLAASVSDKVANHPYLFPTITRGTASQRVMDMARHGTTNLLGNQRTGESLKEIFADFSHKEQEAWKDYAIARHGIENYYAKGLEFGMPKDVLEEVVRQYDSPKFQQALQRVTDYSHRILHLGVDAGLISQEAYDKIVAEHPIYVRITRRKADDGSGTKQGGAAINKRTGGFENILDPIDAMLMDQEKYLRACFQAKSLQLIVGAANRAKAANLQSIRNNGGPNTSTVNPRSQSHIAVSAYWPIEVPNAQEKVTFGAGKLKQGLSDAAADYAARTGEDPIPLEEFINDLATYTDPQGRVTQLSVFRDKPSQGKHNLVSVYVDGKLHTYELPDMKWANMLTDVYDKSDFNWAERAFGLATAGIRLGATTINPGFAIRNGIRDSLHSAVMSETGAIPMLGTLNGMLNQLTGKEAAQMFRSMGGHMSDLVGITREQKWHHGGKVALAQNAFQSAMSYGWDWVLMKPVVKAMSDILSVPELGPRVREFNGVLQKCRAAGLTEDVAAMLAMSHAKDISIDFQRAGRYMKHINHFIPFSNAMWRGTEQTIRNFGLLPAPPHQFEDNNIARGMKTTAKGLAYITSWMATLAMLEMAGDDKDRRRAFERDTVEKWEYAHVGDWRIPLPFELGYVFGAIPKAAIYEIYGDEGAMKECLGAFNQAMPSKYASPNTAIGSISLLTPWIGLLKNEDYRGRAIVPEHIMQNRVKEDWYTQYTTELSKRIGKTIGVSPAQLEYILDAHSGGLYRRTALAVENIGDTSRLQEGRGFSMLDTLRARPQANRLVSDFYKFGEEAKQKLGSGILSLEDYGKFASMNGVKEELTDRFGEMRAIRADKSIPLAEQDKRVQAIAEDVNETIRNFNARDDYRQRGIAYAASHLTGSTLESLDEGTRQQYTALLKDVPTNEIVQALIKFGNETVMVKQKGVKVPHQRWSNKNVNTRVGRLLMLMQGR